MMNFTSAVSIPTRSLNISEVRDKLTELAERTHYRFEQFRIIRQDKPLARIVSDEYMLALEQLMEANPALAETLAIMMDAEAMQAIRQGEKEIAEGNLLPIETILADQQV
ncbi:MAG: type II toxin-antitoxin system Phd/YefM family antitoxin [Anaerolineae bacterium]|nr:type II toxin-antitoxin system Phd/YefM family antitoxin [Anaerolineae bacterium]